ncbi:MAG: hypothetical protein ACXIUV_03055 [Alkalilacustris sp.]
MSVQSSFSRSAVGLAALIFVGLIVAVDAVGSPPIDPFEVPAPAALGSGQASGGAHCSAG